MALTAKQRVLKRYPAAYAVYKGLSLKFVIVNGPNGAELSRYRSRVTDAWISAARTPEVPMPDRNKFYKLLYRR